MTQLTRHHIRRWSQSRKILGQKTQTFAFSCTPCNLNKEYESKHQRDQAIRKHTGEDVS